MTSEISGPNQEPTETTKLELCGEGPATNVCQCSGIRVGLTDMTLAVSWALNINYLYIYLESDPSHCEELSPIV